MTNAAVTAQGAGSALLALLLPYSLGGMRDAVQEEQQPSTRGHITQWLGLMVLQVFINLNNSVIIVH